tara:strand:+ start:969 stop:1241 length:273 start_codon:yes stop_codon:yes gene_type:complete
MSKRSDAIDFVADRDNISKAEAEMKLAEMQPSMVKAIELDASMIRKQKIMEAIKKRKDKGLKIAGGGYLPQSKARMSKLDYRKGGYFDGK